MSKTRRGLGRGLGALIPPSPSTALGGATAESGRPDRPSDMFFERTDLGAGQDQAAEAAGDVGDAPQSSSDGPSPRADGAAADNPAEPGELGPVPGAVFRAIAVGEIRANARQPRTVFDDEALDELTHSIQEFGVLQPIVVRATVTGFELVMGERRLRAAIAAGLDTIPAIIRDTADDQMLRDALLENIHRAQLNPLEEAAAYQQLLAEFGVTHEQLATRIGRSRSQVSNTVRLMNLPVPVQRRVAAGVLSAGHARALLSLDSADAQDDLAARIVTEGLSVRATEELVATAGRDSNPAASAVRRRASRRVSAPAVATLADRLSDVLDTRVKIDLGQRKGRITVEFATVADLDRIIAVMAPQLLPAVRPAAADVDDGPERPSRDNVD